MNTAIRAAFISLTVLSGLGSASTVLANHPPANEFWGTPVHQDKPMQMEMHKVPVDRTVVIEPATDWVRVTGGETVRFVVPGPQGEQSFYWLFDTYNSQSLTFDLNQIAPAGVLDGRSVRVRVDADPRYLPG